MTKAGPTYEDYVRDSTFLDGYHDYQKRYAGKIRESDRVIIEIVHALVGDQPEGKRVLDVGCSTGNLLLHLRNTIPGLVLTGGDMGLGAIETCKSNPELAGIAFEEMNALAVGHREEFDVVLISAVLGIFENDGFEQSVASLGAALRPGGSLVAFDWFHPFEQDLAILETSRTHPNGMMLHFRPQAMARRVLQANGFASVEFRPFQIPIDLPRPEDPGDVGTYTVPTAAGERLLFRGALAQPWCHLVARKAGGPTR